MALTSVRGESEMVAEPVLDEDRVAGRQRARRVFSRDLDNVEPRPFGGLKNGPRQLLHVFDARERRAIGKTAGLGDFRKINPMARVAKLHAGLAIMVVVDNGDDEVARSGDRDSGEAAEGHQLLA